MSEGWKNYIELRHYSPQNHARMQVELDTVWRDTDAQDAIRKAFENNGRNPIVVHDPNVSIQYPNDGTHNLVELSKQVAVSTGTMTFTAPEKYAVAFEMDVFGHKDKNGDVVAPSNASVLYHELYHLAYENEDLLNDLKQHFSASLGTNKDFDNLGKLNDAVSTHLAESLNPIRSEISNQPLLQPHVYMLHYWGALTRDEHDQINERIQSGETMTLQNIEETAGSLAWHDLIRFSQNVLDNNEANPSIRLDINENSLRGHLESVDEHIIAYDSAMATHEEKTVDIVDLNYRTERNEPLRVEYNNITAAPLPKLETSVEQESVPKKLGL